MFYRRISGKYLMDTGAWNPLPHRQDSANSRPDNTTTLGFVKDTLGGDGQESKEVSGDAENKTRGNISRSLGA